jgi:pimeloyl-ACP methyl ester carboxylesterase
VLEVTGYADEKGVHIFHVGTTAMRSKHPAGSAFHAIVRDGTGHVISNTPLFATSGHSDDRTGGPATPYVALSGFVPTVDGWHAELGARRGQPVLIHHGRNDPVIAVDFARRAHERLDEAGLKVEYLESDAGHWLPPEVLPRVRRFVEQVLNGHG